jgi:hypothetical protein
MRKIAFVLCGLLVFAVPVLTQTATKTITNLNLEKFAQKRLEAEREYRATYAAKGLPSPEELRAQADARTKATIELAERLSAAEAERARLESAAIQSQQTAPNIFITNYPSIYASDGLIYSYGLFDGRFGRHFRSHRFPLSGFRGYAAGGMVWPVPIDQRPFQRPQPLFRQARP